MRKSILFAVVLGCCVLFLSGRADFAAQEPPLEFEIGEPPDVERAKPIEKAPPSDASLDEANLRSSDLREERLKAFGGDGESEAAVAAGLAWIVSRQAEYGGWNFNHNLNANKAKCPNPGSAIEASNGATAMALLPLLASGCTHKRGPFEKQVQRGLYYLIAKLKVQGKTGSWHEADGSMYSHALATLAMCDAYAMTDDEELDAPAQLAVNFLAHAQDPIGGGWRYEPKQAGDMSITGLQLLALHKAHRASLEVPAGTVAGAMKFLDSVQSQRGATYGYTGPGAGPATTALGLLPRIHFGWKHDNAALVRGVERLEKLGPSPGNMYYNVFATEVMFQYGGESWERWNAKLRPLLVKSQETREGSAQGSWYFKAGDHGSDRDGRLYCTSLAVMMLQMYYREPRVYAE